MNSDFEIFDMCVACKSLSVEYTLPNGFLGGPHEANFYTNNGFSRIAIRIEQIGYRKITLSAQEQLNAEILFNAYQQLEKLLMLFDGRFIPISKFVFSNSDLFTDDQLKIFSETIMQRRLSYYATADFLQYSANKLIDFDDVISSELFSKWENLIGELDIVHQIILYSVSNSGLPVDAKCAFLIESAEPLVELISVNKKCFSSLKPGAKGTSLKMCLDAIISKYGEDIFKEELNNIYDKFLSILVKSRNRVMHIKRLQEKKCLSNEVAILYSIKLFCLIRRIIFELLGIEYSKYQENLISFIHKYNEWESVLKKFVQEVNSKN